MAGSRKTKAELLAELELLHARVAKLGKSVAKRKRAEAALENAYILERAFSTTHTLIAYMDTDFNFVRVNRAYAEADGREPEFFVGKNHFDLYPNGENEDIFRKVVETGEPYSVYEKPFEYAEHPERGLTYWDWSLFPVKNASGKVEGVLLWLVDQTRRVLAEKELEKHRAHLEEMVQQRTAELEEANRLLHEEIAGRKKVEKALSEAIGKLNSTVEDLRQEKVFSERLIESSVDGIFAFDRDCRFTVWNSGMERISGINKEEVLGRCAFEVFPFLKEIGEDKYLFDTLAGKTVIASDRPYAVPATGRHGHFEAHYSPLRDESSEVVGGLAIIRNITERRRAEEALREANERTREILDSISDSFFSLDDNLVVTYFNKAAERMLGRRSEEVLGRYLFDAFPEARGSIFEEQYTRAVKEKIPLVFETYFGVKPYENWYDVRVYPHKGGISVYFQVTTERKRAEAILRESETRYRLLAEHLEEMVKEKVGELQQAQSLAALGQVVSVVGHEIRNPLQNIRMGADTLRKEIGDDPGKLGVVGEIEHGIRLMDDIVSELLEYSRPVRLECSLWAIRDIVKQALNSLSSRLDNVIVQTELEQEDREITVDATKMLRVLMNLISNAVEAMPDGGNLKIRSQYTERNGESVLNLFISDNGGGISEENLRRIGEPFFTTKAQGTGLGIPICKKIIEAHGGVLTLKSKLSEGTTVEITLPAQNN